MTNRLYVIVRRQYEDEKLVDAKLFNEWYESMALAEQRLFEFSEEEFEHYEFFKCPRDIHDVERSRCDCPYYDSLTYTFGEIKTRIAYEVLCIHKARENKES